LFTAMDANVDFSAPCQSHGLFAPNEAVYASRDGKAKFDIVFNYPEASMTRKTEAGQALMLTALLLVVLMGFAGLAIDMGVMRYEKRLQQTAADAAAIAGASNLGFPDVVSGAQNAAASVGFTDNGGGQVSNCAAGAAVGTICVEVNNPPLTGPHAGDSSSNCTPAPSCYVEVLVAEVHPTYFMKILSINSEPITARAVAANLGSATGNGCMYIGGTPNESIEGLDISGNAILNASNCRILDDGNYTNTGGASTINAYSIGVSGSSIGGGSGSVACVATGPCPTFGVPASFDPLQNLPVPAVQSPSFGTVTTAGTWTLQPGTYSSIIIGSGSTVTFNPGIYYISAPGSVTFAGPATVKGSGVTIYLEKGTTPSNGASIDMVASGNQVSNIQLTAPTSGTYAGILIFQDSRDFQNTTIGGDNSSFFDGALYFPEGKITFFGNAGAGFNVAFVDADEVVLGGSTTVNLLGSSALPAGVNLMMNATIVE
jgi:putative Flp pilus-assembly TadE/G-like protein